MRLFNNVILGLDSRIQTTRPPLDSRSRIKYGTSFAGMTPNHYETLSLDQWFDLNVW